MISEPGLGRTPVRHRVPILFTGRLKFCCIPIFVSIRITLDIKSLSISFTQRWVKDKLWSTTRITDSLSLIESHVVSHTMFRLAGRETLEKTSTTILKSIENRPEKLRRIRN